VDRALRWSILPGCGGIVTFCGTVRDHSDGRPGVTSLEYEAYLEHVRAPPDLRGGQARTRWPEIGRLVLLHRVGRLEVGDISVVVVTSTPTGVSLCLRAILYRHPQAHRSDLEAHETWRGADRIGVPARATMRTRERPLPSQRRGPRRGDTPRRSAAIRAGALRSPPTSARSPSKKLSAAS